jgi:hypothetical protein
LFVHEGHFAFTSEMPFATFDIEPPEALWPEHVIVYGEPGQATFPGRRPASGQGRERRAPSARGRDGGVVIADGPFAETKEQIAGVLIVECADRSEAIKVAAWVPAAHYRTIEVENSEPAREGKPGLCDRTQPAGEGHGTWMTGISQTSLLARPGPGKVVDPPSRQSPPRRAARPRRR